MQAVLDAILKRFITIGQLTVRWPDGRVQTYGSGNPRAAMAIRTREAVRQLVLNPALKAGECYMDGGLAPDGCGIYDLLDLLVRNLAANGASHPMARIRSSLGQIRRRPRAHARS